MMFIILTVLITVKEELNILKIKIPYADTVFVKMWVFRQCFNHLELYMLKSNLFPIHMNQPNPKQLPHPLY